MDHHKLSQSVLMTKISRWLAGAGDREGGRKERALNEVIN